MRKSWQPSRLAVEPYAGTLQSLLHVIRVVNRTQVSENGIPWRRTVRVPHAVDANCERLVVRRKTGDLAILGDVAGL